MGGTTDDWAAGGRLATLLADTAVREIVFDGAATYLCKSKLSLPNRALELSGNGSRIVQSLVYSGVDPFNAAFACAPVTTVTTTLAANVTVGGRTISTVASIAAGTIVCVMRSGLRALYYKTVGAPVGAGPYTITLDRNIVEAFLLGDNVVSCSSQPQFLRIHDFKMSGTGDRYIELAGAEHSIVKDIHFDATDGILGAGGVCASYDIGGFDNVFDHLVADAGGNCNTGAWLESNEASVIRNCNLGGFTGRGAGMADCWSSAIKGGTYYGSQYGCFMNSDGGAVGCYDCVVESVTCSDNTNTGIGITGPSHRCRIININAHRNVNAGIYISGAGNGNQIQGASCHGNAYGIWFAAGTNSQISDIDCQDNTTNDILLQTGVNGRNITCKGAAPKNIYASGAIRVNLSGLNIENTAAAGSGYRGIFGDAAAVVNIEDSYITSAGQGVCITGAGTTARIHHSRVDSATYQTVVYNTSILRIGAGVRITGAGSMYYQSATAERNVGSLTLNGATPVAIAFADITAVDQVTLTPTAINGATAQQDPVVTITPGTGFSVVSVANDTRIMQYKIV